MKGNNYNQIFREAVNNVIEMYRQREIQLLTESDLQSHLFAECLRLMKQNNFPLPLKIFAERGVFDKRSKIDLVLGDDEVLVELKFEPVWEVGGQGRVFTTVKSAGGMGYGSIEADLYKVEHYADNGKHSHFVMVDENGWHSQKIETEKWVQVNAPSGKAVLLHLYQEPNGLPNQLKGKR